MYTKPRAASQEKRLSSDCLPARLLQGLKKETVDPAHLMAGHPAY